MPRNVELIQKLFGSKHPIPSIELAYNALMLGGIPAHLYALKEDLSGEVDVMLKNIQEVIDDLKMHEKDDIRHLTQDQIDKIISAIDATKALQIANSAIDNAKSSIISESVQSATKQANTYTDAELKALRKDLEDEIGKLNVGEKTDPETGETTEQTLSEALENNPHTLINPEYFYSFKNMIVNSSFEVFDGNTKIPLGWDNGVVSADASMFGTYSLKLTTGQVAKQTSKYQVDVNWMKNAYDTKEVILCFYHKFDSAIVRVWDEEYEEFLDLTKLNSNLSEAETGKSITFPYSANWNQYRCMVKFKPKALTEKIRVEFACGNGSKGACYIDAPSMEPYVEGEFPSIYKDGMYSVSANQLLNPPPDDVDRFTPLEHLNIANSQYDDKGNITYQELLRNDGSLAIKREASNPDTNGNYQTIVETFYKGDGSINYVDTYSYTFTSNGAILTKSKTTTEVV